jgi:hypothetical protein
MDKRKLPMTEEHKLNLSLAQKGKPRLYAIGNKYCLGKSPWNKNTKGLMPTPWNKNTNIQSNTGRTHFKKGEHPSLKTEFGNKPAWNKGKKLHYKVWNKGTVGVMKAWNKGTGVTHWLENFKHLPEYKLWRKSVFERDNYTCQDCKNSNCYLQAHHNKSRAEIFKQFNILTLNDALACKELWDVNNGLTLCKKCHKKTKSYGKKFIQV